MSTEVKTFHAILPGHKYVFLLNYRVLEKNMERVHHEFIPSPGDSISSFAAGIVQFLQNVSEGDSLGQMLAFAVGAGSSAKTRAITGEFKFNGQDFQVSIMDTTVGIVKQYSDRMEEASTAYKNSEKGRAAALARLEINRRAQLVVNTETDQLALLAEEYDRLWNTEKQPEGGIGIQVWRSLYELSRAAQNADKLDAPRLLTALEKLNYKENELVGDDSDIRTLANHRAYVAGQIIGTLKMGFIHQMTIYFIERRNLCALDDASAGFETQGE